MVAQAFWAGKRTSSQKVDKTGDLSAMLVASIRRVFVKDLIRESCKGLHPLECAHGRGPLSAPTSRAEPAERQHRVRLSVTSAAGVVRATGTMAPEQALEYECSV